MRCKIFPAVLVVCALSFPRPGGATVRSPRFMPSPPPASVSLLSALWQRLVDLVPTADRRGPGRLTAVWSRAGCEMDPDGRLRTLPTAPSNP